MVAENTDLFIKASPDWTGAVGGGGVADASVTTVPLVSSTSLPTDTAVQVTIDRVDANGTATPSKKEVITGVVSGSNIIDCLRGVEGTAQAHSAGAVVEVMLTASMWNNEIDGFLAEHNQDGTHTNPFSATTLASVTHAATGKTTPVDADELALIDSAASNVLKKLTWANLKATLLTWLRLSTTIIPQNAPQGFLINGKISVTDAAGITVAIKTLAGTDPSATDPVYVRIGDTVHTISAALPVAKADGTNWFNAGSAELATKETDYFVYLGYNATDGVVIGFSRYPGANQYSDFSATTTNEKYCAISTITTAAATDYYEVVGRFAATLSAGAGYTWSVPTFTASNLIQRPIYETRKRMSYATVWTGFSANPSVATNYQIIGTRMLLEDVFTSNGTSNATTLTRTIPFAVVGSNRQHVVGFAADNSANLSSPARVDTAGTATLTFYKDGTGAAWTGSGTKVVSMNMQFDI